MPSIALASDELGVTPIDIELIAVSIGPGGFTGLRTSIAFAKMISYATHANIIPIESAIVIANGANKGDGPFLVVSSVKQQSFWLSRVERRDRVWECAARLSGVDDFGAQTVGVTAVFGDEFVPSEMCQTLQKQDIPLFESKCNARSLLEIAIRKSTLGVFVDPLQLFPIYPRVPEAVRVWNERNQPNT